MDDYKTKPKAQSLAQSLAQLRSIIISLLCGLFLVYTLYGCAADIAPSDNESQSAEEINLPPSTFVIDASDREAWIYFDLDASFDSLDQEEEGWDLAFQRFKVKSNGGISGEGGVEVAIVDEVSFEDLKEAPSALYLVDQDDSDDEGETPDYVFNTEGEWYEYDLSTHTLAPRAQIYIVHSTDDQYFKLRFLDYYNDVGDPALIKVMIAQINPPSSN